MTTAPQLDRPPDEASEPDAAIARRRDTGTSGMRLAYAAPATPPRDWSRWYLSTKARFALAALAALGWTGLSVWISLPWLRDLGDVITPVPAVLVITFLAFLPGCFVAFLVVGLLVDRQPPLADVHPTTPVAVLIAARNEAAVIAETLDYLAASDYDGPVHAVLIDNGSSDGTAELARRAAERTGLRLTVLHEAQAGKNFALNAGLAAVDTPLVCTVDADTLLHPSALRMLVARLENSPEDVVAVAGHLMVRNSRASVWARLQVWDYLLGIAAVKRVQGLFQGTLVAQGAFSVYRTDVVRDAGAWPAAIGEDIVLTWRLLLRGRVFHEPLALAFTGVPETLAALTRQRSRWARGMLEGIRSVPPWRQPRGSVRGLALVDLVIPFLDLVYVGAWVPGVVLACFGYFWVVGPMSAAVLPLTVALYGLLYRAQRRTVLEPLQLKPRRDPVSFVLFLTIYQALMSAMSVRGYVQHLAHRRHTWK